MTDLHSEAVLDTFRSLADSMRGPGEQTYNWRGEFISQSRMGCTLAEAQALVAKSGGKIITDAEIEAAYQARLAAKRGAR